MKIKFENYIIHSKYNDGINPKQGIDDPHLSSDSIFTFGINQTLDSCDDDNGKGMIAENQI